MCSQSCLIKNCIFIHQRNSFIPILEAVNQLTKNAQAIIHEFIIIHNEVHTFQDTNTTLAKCQKTKRTCLQKKSTFSQKNSKILSAEKK